MEPVIHYTADLIELVLRQKAEDIYDAYRFDEEVQEFCYKWLYLFDALNLYGEVYYFTKEAFIKNFHSTIFTEDNKILIRIDDSGSEQLKEEAKKFFKKILDKYKNVIDLEVKPTQLNAMVDSFIETIKEMFEITHRAAPAREL